MNRTEKEFEKVIFLPFQLLKDEKLEMYAIQKLWQRCARKVRYMFNSPIVCKKRHMFAKPKVRKANIFNIKNF